MALAGHQRDPCGNGNVLSWLLQCRRPGGDSLRRFGSWLPLGKHGCLCIHRVSTITSRFKECNFKEVDGLLLALYKNPSWASYLRSKKTALLAQLRTPCELVFITLNPFQELLFAAGAPTTLTPVLSVLKRTVPFLPQGSQSPLLFLRA